jgi:2-keto-3-deoxy-L-rhamnonate aldolase RhmA
MRDNPVKRKLARGEPVFGPMILDFINPGLAQIVANAGADFIMYDQEAGCLDTGGLKNQLALCRGLGLVPLVNPAWDDYHPLVRPLDMGAMGLMTPVVQTKEQAERIAKLTHYPPRGARGVAFGIAHDDYDLGAIAPKIRAADARILNIVKIETKKGVENVDAIMAVPGIDVAFIGHMDLSVSLGVPGKFDHPVYRAAEAKILRACRKHGKAAGCMAMDAKAGKRRLKQGFRFIVTATDVFLLSTALGGMIDELKPKPKRRWR